ncbi:MAG: antibiotic biosynthesis monooxygenase [Streptosporangiales bacterium]|nr:antibiotic biosynthesis monooxygenase [Streptosporangiales bacterium]
MTETTIRPTDGLMTLINVFTVAPEHQQELVDVLLDATERVMSRIPGFVSANIHRSDARTHMARAMQLASSEPIVCEVAYVHHA